MMCFNIDMSSWRLVLELFLREDVSHCRALLLRIFLGFDLRLVRLVLVSVFRSLLDLCDLDVRFDAPPWYSLPSAVPKSPRARRDSLDFVSAWAWTCHLCSRWHVVHLGGHCHIHESSVSASYCCSSPQMLSSRSERCSLSLQLVSLRRA